MYPGKFPRRTKPSLPLAVLSIAAICAVYGPAAAQGVAPGAAVELHIDKISLADALLQIGRRTGVAVSFDPAVLRNYVSSPVHGNFRAEEALRVALAGSDLTFVEREKNVFVITRTEKKPDQERRATGVVELPDVVVQARRRSLGYAADATRTASRSDTSLLDLAKSVSTVPRELLDDQQTASMLEALKNTSGVRGDFLGPNSTAAMSVRGFTVEQAMTDGLMSSSTAAFQTPMIAVEKIEVIKGPESIIGGTAAKFGGVVNLVMKAPKADPSKEIQYTVDTSGKAQVGLDLTGAVSEDREIRARLIASSEYSGTPYKTWDGGNDYYIAPSVMWKTAQNKLTLGVQAQNSTLPLTAGYKYGGGYDVRDSEMVDMNHSPSDHAKLKLRRFNFDYERELTPIWKVAVRGQYQSSNQARAYWYQTPLGYPLGTAPVALFAAQDSLKENARAFQADLTGSFNWGDIEHRIVAGLDYAVTSSDARNRLRFDKEMIQMVVAGTSSILPSVESLPNVFPAGDFRDSTKETGVFLQDQIAIGERLHLSGTLRWVGVKARYGSEFPTVSKVLPGVGALYKWDPSTSIYGSVVKGVNSSARGTTRDGSGLPPTEAKQAEVGIKKAMFDERLIGTISAYRIEKTNVPQADLDNSGYFHIVKGQVSKGVEVELNGRLTPAWNVSAAYTYLDMESDPGSPLLEHKHLLNLWTHYRFSQERLSGWSLGLGLVARSEETVTIPSMKYTGKNPGAARVDAVLGYDAKAWNMKLGFRNLLGRDMYVNGSIPQMARKEQKDLVTLTGSIKF